MNPAHTHANAVSTPRSHSVQLPQDPRALIAPLLSGLSFLAGHGYMRRGQELSVVCRFPQPTSSAMILEVAHERGQRFDLEGISFRVKLDSETHGHQLVTLDSSGRARLEGIARGSRVLIELAPERRHLDALKMPSLQHERGV